MVVAKSKSKRGLDANRASHKLESAGQDLHRATRLRSQSREKRHHDLFFTTRWRNFAWNIKPSTNMRKIKSKTKKAFHHCFLFLVQKLVGAHPETLKWAVASFRQNYKSTKYKGSSFWSWSDLSWEGFSTALCLRTLLVRGSCPYKAATHRAALIPIHRAVKWQNGGLLSSSLIVNCLPLYGRCLHQACLDPVDRPLALLRPPEFGFFVQVLLLRGVIWTVCDNEENINKKEQRPHSHSLKSPAGHLLQNFSI